MSRGTMVVLVMFGVAIVLGFVAFWWHREQGDEALEFWGRDSAQLIRHAPNVELLWLRTGEEPESAEIVERFAIDRQEVTAIARQDISGARGLVHMRHALITDNSFAWDRPRGDCQPQWVFVLRFADGDRQAAVAVDRRCQRVRLLGTDRDASIAPLIDALDGFLQRQKEIEPEPAAETPTDN